MSILHHLNHIAAYPIIRMIYVYQWTLSPDKSFLFSPFLRGRICAHEPHCSAYGIQVLKKYGLFPGIIYMVDRITSCTPSPTKKHDPSTLRVVFASSAPIGVPFLEKITSDPRYNLVGVVTNPDVPSGRGMKVKPNIIKTTAEKYIKGDEPCTCGGCHETKDSIAIQNNTQKNDFIQTPRSLRLTSKKYSEEAKTFKKWLTAKKPDLLVVIAYGKIIPQHILDIPAIAPINVHGSLLPKYRGASPIQSVLLDNESETGITIMRMEAGLDTGPMLSKKSFPLTIHTTTLDIIQKFQSFGPKQLVNTMRDYAKGHISEQPQNDSESTHCSKLEKSDGQINPRSQSLHEINNIYRGCYLWPKTHFVLPAGRGDHTGKTITIDKITLDESLWKQHKEKPLISDTDINPAITSLMLKPANKKAISWENFVRGYHKSQ